MYRKLILPVFAMVAVLVGLSACGNGQSVMSTAGIGASGAGKVELIVYPEEYESDKWQAAARSGPGIVCEEVLMPNNSPRLGNCDENAPPGARAGLCNNTTCAGGIDLCCSLASFHAGEACETDDDCRGAPCASSNAHCVDAQNAGICLGLPQRCELDCSDCFSFCQAGMPALCERCVALGCVKGESSRSSSGTVRMR